MTTDSTGGLASYQGYEFQIEATAWIAVYLLLHHEGWTQLVVEPASEEDIQVDLRPRREAEDVLGEAEASIGATSLEIQIKLNRSKPWTVARFAALLEHGERRKPPLKALAANSQSRFLLVTTFTVASELRSYEVQSPLDGRKSISREDALCTRLGSAAARHVSRISILGLSTKPRHEIQDVLTRLHVPPTRWEACMGALTTAVRERLLGKADRRWTRQAVLDIVTAHDGFIATPKLYEPFVEPDRFEAIRERLRTQNMLVLLGPAGAGKTLAADALALEHRLLEPAYEIKRDPANFAEIDQLRESAGPYLFLIGDPWGKEQRDARGQHWLDELRKLAPLARRHFRFIVTSPLGVLAEAPGIDERIRRHAVTIDANNYGVWTRIKILECHANQKLEGDRREWVLEQSWRIAAGLDLPLSIACFIGQVRALPKGTQPDLEALLSASLSEAEATRFLDELRNNSTIPDITVYIVWCALAASLRASDDLLGRVDDAWLDRNPTEPIYLQLAFQWLLESGWWKPPDSSLSVRTERISRLRAWVELSGAPAKRVLVRFELAVLDAGDLESMLQIRRVLAPLGMAPLGPVQTTLQRYMQERVDALTMAVDIVAFHEAVRRIDVNVPSEEPVVAIIQALEDTTRQSRKSSWFGWDVWAPPDWSPDRLAWVAGSDAGKALARRWVLECLPDNRLEHGDGALLEFLDRLGWDLSVEFREALFDGRRRSTDEILVAGALHTAEPDFLGIMDMLVREWSEERKAVDRRLDDHDVRRASQKQLDEGYEEHVLESLWDDVVAIEHSLQHWAKLWRGARAAPWPSAPSEQPAVLKAWADVLKEDDAQPQLEEIRTLLDSADGSVKERALEALGSSNLAVQPLLGRIRDSIAVGTIDEATAGLLALLKRGEIQLAASYAAESSRDRQVELGLSCRKRGSRPAESISEDVLASVFAPIANTVVAKLHADDAKEPLTHDEIMILRTLATKPDQIRRLAIETLSLHGQANAGLAMSLLESEDVDDRLAGLKLVEDLGLTNACDLLRGMLGDAHWKCREAAVKQLARNPSCDGWAELLQLAKDASWPVAKAVAEVLAEHSKRATVSIALELLENDNDQSGDGGFSKGPIFEVARAGARLLDELSLPDYVIETLLVMVRTRARTAQDWRVRGTIARAIMHDRPLVTLSLLIEDPQLAHIAIELLDARPELREQLDVAQAIELAGNDDSWAGDAWAMILGLLGDRVRPAVERAIGLGRYTPWRTTVVALGFLCLSKPLSATVLEGRLPSWPDMLKSLFPSERKTYGLTMADLVVRALRPRYDRAFDAGADS